MAVKLLIIGWEDGSAKDREHDSESERLDLLPGIYERRSQNKIEKTSVSNRHANLDLS